jgi:hypothetical protein
MDSYLDGNWSMQYSMLTCGSVALPEALYQIWRQCAV